MYTFLRHRLTRWWWSNLETEGIGGY